MYPTSNFQFSFDMSYNPFANHAPNEQNAQIAGNQANNMQQGMDETEEQGGIKRASDRPYAYGNPCVKKRRYNTPRQDSWQSVISDAVRKKNLDAAISLIKSMNAIKLEVPIESYIDVWQLCEELGRNELGLSIQNEMEQQYPNWELYTKKC